MVIAHAQKSFFLSPRAGARRERRVGRAGSRHENSPTQTTARARVPSIYQSDRGPTSEGSRRALLIRRQARAHCTPNQSPSAAARVASRPRGRLRPSRAQSNPGGRRLSSRDAPREGQGARHPKGVEQRDDRGDLREREHAEPRRRPGRARARRRRRPSQSDLLVAPGFLGRLVPPRVVWDVDHRRVLLLGLVLIDASLRARSCARSAQPAPGLQVGFPHALHVPLAASIQPIFTNRPSILLKHPHAHVSDASIHSIASRASRRGRPSSRLPPLL